MLYSPLERHASTAARLFWQLLWVLALLGMSLPTAGAAAPLPLDADSRAGQRPLLSWTEADIERVDPDMASTLDGWSEPAAKALALNFRRDPIWLRFAVEAPASAATWLLQIPDPLLDDIRIFQRQPGGGWIETRMGDRQPAPPGAVDAIGNVLPITLTPDQPTEFLLWIASESSMLVDVRIHTARSFHAHSQASANAYGLMFGVIAAMLLYNFFLFLSLRDPNYLLYVCGVAASTLFLACFSGHAPRWLWPEQGVHNEMIFLHIVAANLFFNLWFCTRFLEARHYAPRMHQTILVLMGLSVLTLPIAHLFDFFTSVHLTGAVSGTAGTVGLLTAALCWRNGQQSARFYLLAWSGYCVGTVFTAARQHGLAENTFLTTHGMEIGAVMEAVLISFALADRYNRLKAEKEAAQARVAEELRRMDKLKDEFLANTSHELRTPLHGIIGLAESMLDGAAGTLETAARKNLAMIANSGQRLAKLVDDILDFSRMRQSELRLRRRAVDLHVAADVVLALSAPLTQGKTLTLVNAVPADLPPVDADEDRLQQILYNLVGNAIKFSDTGTVQICAEAEADGRIRVHVVDEGPGIAPDQQQRIYESFAQIEDSATRQHGGTGLGLAVTQLLVRLHGDEIALRSAPGEGADFSFCLPVAAAELKPVSGGARRLAQLREELEAPEEAAPDVVATALAATVEGDAPHRILIVDDEPVNQQVLANHLRLARYEIDQAMNGEEALALLERADNHYDLMLLDIMMPRMSGYEVCRIIRERKLPTQLPIIMVTAKNQVADMVAGLDSGANDYLSKPFTRDELLARIKTHLNLFKINDAYARYVPHEFLQQLARESILDVKLGDSAELDVGVFVSDIRGFTTLSETMSPTDNFRFINGYFRRMAPVIREHGGFISRYTGDAIMGLFPGGAQGAVAAALASQQRLGEYNVERTAKGRNNLRIGIGVHFGSTRIGVVGEAQRRQGEVFSDAINLAARIEELTKHYGTSLILSADVQGRLGAVAPRCRWLDRIVVRGRTQPIDLYEVLDGLPDADIRWAQRDIYEAALQSLLDNEPEAALQGLQSVLEQNPMDMPAQRLRERAQSLLAEKLPRSA